MIQFSDILHNTDLTGVTVDHKHDIEYATCFTLKGASVCHMTSEKSMREM